MSQLYSHDDADELEMSLFFFFFTLIWGHKSTTDRRNTLNVQKSFSFFLLTALKSSFFYVVIVKVINLCKCIYSKVEIGMPNSV